MRLDPRAIENWASTGDAAAEFPNVVRRLILATAPHLVLVDMPGGSSVRLPGWDGRTRANAGNEWVPGGDCVWELSCEADPRQKANRDYANRLADLRGLDPQLTTYVAVTARVFPNSDTWEAERRDRGDWRDVRVVDAEIVSAWLEQAPAVAEQFARLIGLRPDGGYLALDEWWRGWAGPTSPDISPGLVLAGRDAHADELADWFGREPVGYFVQGDTREEAIAFLAAAAHRAENAWGAEFLARALVVRDVDAWRDLCFSSSPLVLIRDFEDHVVPAVMPGSGHRTVVPLDGTQDALGQGIKLPQMGRDETVGALVEMGLAENEAVSLSWQTARRLAGLRRRLANSSGEPGPAWLTSPILRMIAPLVLVGQWEDDHPGDRDIVGLLTGKDYVEVQGEVTELAGLADAPLVKVGNRWRFWSQEEAWDLLAKGLTSSDLEKFRAVAVAVFSAVPPPLPRWDTLEHLLQEEKATEPSGADGVRSIRRSVLRGLKRGWQAVKRKFGSKSVADEGPTDGEVPARDLPTGLLGSGTIRQGMSRTLVIMALDPDRALYEAECALLPRQVVAEVLGKTVDHQVWESLGSCLSVLAEAAPNEFMGAVDAAVEVAPSPFALLFSDEPGWSSSDFRCSGLFWSLERLAWSEEHFARVADLVVRLGQIAVGSSAERRAFDCASGLFDPSIRFTDASDEARLSALERLVDRYPEAGWRVLCDTYPTSRGFLLGRSPPVWRPWGAGGAGQSTRGEYFAYVAALERMVVEKVGCDPVRWNGVLDIHWFMSGYVRRSLVWLLSQRVAEIRRREGSVYLWHEARRKISWYREHKDARHGYAGMVY